MQQASLASPATGFLSALLCKKFTAGITALGGAHNDVAYVVVSYVGERQAELDEIAGRWRASVSKAPELTARSKRLPRYRQAREGNFLVTFAVSAKVPSAA